MIQIAANVPSIDVHLKYLITYYLDNLKKLRVN